MILAATILGTILLPPPALDHEPRSPMIVYRHEFSLEQIEAECHKLGVLESDVQACSLRMGDGACLVYLPKIGPGGVSARDYALLYRHEVHGHCNERVPNPNHVGWK